jgi:hypothetical protein
MQIEKLFDASPAAGSRVAFGKQPFTVTRNSAV